MLPVCPPPPPPSRLPKPSSLQPLSVQQLLKEKRLKKTDGPKVTVLGLKVVNVLLITKFWGCYSWFSEGIKLVLITSPEAEQARLEFVRDTTNPRAKECEKAFTQVCIVENYSVGGEVELLAFKLHTKYNFTHVIVHTENDLIRAARIRDLLGLKTGQSLQNALRYRDKVVMKTLCANTGLLVPKFGVVESASDILKFVRDHGLPVVVKPRLGYSSVDTIVLRVMEDVENFCKNKLVHPGIDPIYGLEIESFVFGDMYHIDGLVIDETLVICWPSKYIGTVMKFETNPYIAGYGLSPFNPLVDALNTYVEAVITCLGSGTDKNPPHFPFHAEVWVNEKNNIVLCEIASRGGGGNIKKEITELFGINMDEIWTCAQCGDACDFFFSHFWFITSSLEACQKPLRKI
eukprot:TRINITY_DN4149_c0_g1_i3.p1 TRINITY_DN4149_c0_g1~~TRINITY_DN4149_c0_g1_i3.p1  ORF type:complete len:419 (-),score=97.73 TRINITY_DN4149_c0_g1_i3:358-1569(-)